jgi:hypothetical protein
VPGVGRVEVLVELADPCEAFSYLVDGLPMSDFVTRSYYGPHRWHVATATPAGMGPVTRPFSFTGQLDAPLIVARGGYLSFVDPVTDEWGQITWFGGSAPSVRQLGRRDEADPRSHREWIDTQTFEAAREHVGAVAAD